MQIEWHVKQPNTTYFSELDSGDVFQFGDEHDYNFYMKLDHDEDDNNVDGLIVNLETGAVSECTSLRLCIIKNVKLVIDEQNESIYGRDYV